MTSLPASPSWRKQLSRSPGAPGRLLRRRRDNDHPDDFFNSALGRRNHAFLGSSWLLTPAQNVYRQPTLTTSSNATKSHTPFLTIALLKLNEVLPDFVQTSQLGDPALAAKACAVLDSSVATAGSPYNSPAASPASSASRHSAASPRKDRATSSIGSSSSAPVGQRGPPLLQWLTSSADSRRENHASTSPASSALVIEGEWETYVAPFLLLAAAEVLYHDMQLQGLAVIYQRIIADMLSVKQILCDPILGQLLLTPPASATASSMLMTSVEAATSLATMIDTLTAFCTCRIQLVDLQRTCTPQALALFTVLLQTASAHPQRNELFERLLQECNAWKFCIETCLALEQCRFSETILALRQWKNYLPPPTDGTRLAKWMHESFQRTASLLSIYFDRIQAFATPLYGFSIVVHKGGYDSLNGEMLDFLRRQEKAGGPPTAVALVLDAVGTSNLHVERGVQLQEEETKNENDPRVCWPAVYMRSSFFLAAQSRRQGLGSSPEVQTTGGLLSPSQSNLLPNWAKSSGSSPNSRLSKRKSFRSEAQALFEYGPQSGPATTWPHFEWERLVALLNSEETQVEHQIAMDDPLETEPSAVQAATYRVKDDDDKVMRESLMSLEDAANLFHSVRNMSPDADADAHAPMLPSVIHTIPLSQYMHLVVIVKGEEEEEQRWHRRRLKPLSDFEIRAFLQEMAGKLRVSEIFGRTPEVDMEIPLAIEDLIVTGSSDPNEKKSMLTDEEAKSLLRSIKEAFGLRPVSPLRTDSLRGKSPNLSRRRQSSRRSSRSKTEKPQLDKSAAAFFLGSALADVI